MIQTEIPLEHQIAAARREVRLRRSVYPNLVARGRMLQETADRELACMQAIVTTLTQVLEQTQMELFSHE
jgi:hypothetical protein